MPFDLSDSQTLMWFLAGIPVAWLVGTVLFVAGCALADVPEISFKRSLLVAGLSLVVCVPLGWFIYFTFDKLDRSSTDIFSTMRLLGIGLAVLAFWIVSAVLFRVMRAAPTFKALLVSLYELLLGTLLSALVVGVIFVVIAFRQIKNPPTTPQKAWLTPPTAGPAERT